MLTSTVDLDPEREKTGLYSLREIYWRALATSYTIVLLCDRMGLLNQLLPFINSYVQRGGIWGIRQGTYRWMVVNLVMLWSAILMTWRFHHHLGSVESISCSLCTLKRSYLPIRWLKRSWCFHISEGIANLIKCMSVFIGVCVKVAGQWKVAFINISTPLLFLEMSKAAPLL